MWWTSRPGKLRGEQAFRPGNRIRGQCGPGHRRWYAVAIGLVGPALDDPIALANTDLVPARVGRSPSASGQATWAGTVRLLTVLVVLYFLGPAVDSVWPLEGTSWWWLSPRRHLHVLWLLATLRLPHRNADWRALLPGAGAVRRGRHAARNAHALRDRAVCIFRRTRTARSGSRLPYSGLFLIARPVATSAVLNATLWERRPREAGET